VPIGLQSLRIGLSMALRIGLDSPTTVNVYPILGDSNAYGQGVTNNADGGFGLTTPFTTVQLSSHIAPGVAFPPVFADFVGTLQPYTNPNNPSMGIELTMGQALFAAGAKPLMAVMAVSGSTLATEWLPTSTYPAAGAGNLYNLFVARMRALGTVRAITVHLGTNDASTAPMSSAFQSNMTAFLAALRADFSAGLVVAWVKTNVNGSGAFTSTVRAAQVAVAAGDPNLLLIDNDDIALTDGFHFDADGYITIGQRAAFAIADKLGLARQTVTTTPAVLGWGPAAHGAGALAPRSWPGTLVGDLELGIGTTGLVAAAQTTPAGWALVASTNLTSVFAGLNQQVALYQRAGSNGGAATAFADTNNFNAFKCFTVRGPNANPAIDVVNGSVNNNFDTGPLSIPSITTTAANEIVLIFQGGYSGGANGYAATNAGLTSVQLIQSGTYAIGSDFQVIGLTSGIKAAAGATGAASGTSTNSAITVGLQIGIKP
jgi:lysophospholipase L1-like esterase